LQKDQLIKVDARKIHDSINSHILMQDHEDRDDLNSNSGRDSSYDNRDGSLISSRSSGSQKQFQINEL
jgi:hypothetical protein